MKKTVVGILDIVHYLAITFWLGGMIVLGFLVAPSLFQTTLLATSDAEQVYRTLLSRFTVWVEICGVSMVVVQFLLRRRFQKQRSLYILDAVRQLTTFLALLLAEMCFRNLLPNMNVSKRVGELADVTHLGGTYANLAIAQAAMLLLVLGITVWLTLPASVGATRRANLPEELPSSSPQTRRRRKS